MSLAELPRSFAHLGLLFYLAVSVTAEPITPAPPATTNHGVSYKLSAATYKLPSLTGYSFGDQSPLNVALQKRDDCGDDSYCFVSECCGTGCAGNCCALDDGGSKAGPISHRVIQFSLGRA